MIRGFVEALERRVAGSRELLDAIVGLLGERQIRGGAFDRGLALRDLLGSRTGLDIGELGGGDREASFRFLKLGYEFRIVDLVQQLAGGDIVAALNRALANPAVDARRDVDASGVRFSLNDQEAAAGRDTIATGRRSPRQ